MCGINGILASMDEFAMQDTIMHMNANLAHRGPDALGFFADDGIGLGHRRLSIIDLSEAGRQPMFSDDGRLVIVFNGEIYNYKTLKNTLKNYPFKSNTDTEVLLALYTIYGSDMLEKLDGMFALAIWDKEEKSLFLARDRFGKKPLYYYDKNNEFIFSSEIRAMLQTNKIPRFANEKAIYNFLLYQTIFSPDTIIDGIKMLPSGCFAKYKNNQLSINRYYDVQQTKDKYNLSGPYSNVIKETKELFFKAVEKRLISDVPLGAFLSGGIDSTCIVSAMSKLKGSGVHTFHITHSNEQFDEKKYAEIVAKRYATNHTNIELNDELFLHEIPKALELMDHPSFDGANTFIVSKYAKQAGLTVALSGAGGDELFGGYPVFGYMQKLLKYKKAEKIPLSIKNIIFKLIKQKLSTDAKEKLNELIKSQNWNPYSIYPIFRKCFLESEIRSAGIYCDEKLMDFSNTNFEKNKLMAWISAAEMGTYLENVLLQDSDQMGMANSLEIRNPFLDKDLIGYVLNLPDDFKPIQTPKQLLIDAMKDEIPEEVWNRKKMGFVLPYKFWINNELKEFCRFNLEFLIDANILGEGFVNTYLNTLETGTENKQWSKVWNLVVLGYWMGKNNVGIRKEENSNLY